MALQNPMEPPTLPSHVLTGIRNSNLVESVYCASTEDHPDQRAGESTILLLSQLHQHFLPASEDSCNRISCFQCAVLEAAMPYNTTFTERASEATLVCRDDCAK